MPVWAMTVPQRRPRDAPAEAVDEDQVEDDVRRETSDRRDQRGPGVLQPAQHAGGGQGHEHGRDADGRDAQVGGGVPERGGRGAEHPAQRLGRGGHRDGDDGADRHRQPGAVDARPEGAALRAGPDLARDDRGGAVGQEDEEVGGGEQGGAGDAEAGELGGAEVPDDRRVGEQEHRLGHQGQERGHGEAQDLPALVTALPPQHRATVASPALVDARGWMRVVATSRDPAG